MGQCNMLSTEVAVKLATIVATYCKQWVGLPINQVKRRMIHNFDALKFMWKNSFVSAGPDLIYSYRYLTYVFHCYCQCFGLRIKVNADPVG
jgi:hypothetical protein